MLVEVTAGVVTGVLIGVFTMSSRSGTGRRARVVAVVRASAHTVRDIDPGESVNMEAWLASEWTQASPQSICLNDVAP